MKPVVPWNVVEGGDYWAAWGSKGWTAVRVLSAKRKWASVARVNPRTNETKSRNAKVRIDELVVRDPKQKGKDKPSDGPPAEDEPAPRLGAWAGLSPEEVDKRQRSIWEKLHGKGSWDNVPTVDDW